MPTHLSEETALVAAARLGDHESFSTLARHYQANLYRIALRILGNHEDAEDVVQEALLKAYCSLKNFQGNSRFYTWMARIAVNEALMKIRKKRAYQYKEVSLQELVQFNGVGLPREIQDSRKNPENRCAELEMQALLTKALSPRLSQAFLLRNTEEFSVKETAAMLGLSVSAVKSRLIRARAQLQSRANAVIAGRADNLNHTHEPHQCNL